jgi:nitroreductase
MMRGMSAPSRTDVSAPVDPLFTGRWAPRAFSPEPIPQETLDSLFEAARYAPSSANEQPWLFLYASTEEELALFRPLLVDANRLWADKAPVVAFAFARRTFERNGKPNRWAAFDTGAAWMSLALQAHLLGLVTHAMGGIHDEKVYEVLGVPQGEYEVMCGIAIGKYGNPEELAENFRAREKPSPRKPREQVAIRGRFRAPGK